MRADILLTDLSITERVFAGLENRPDEIVLTDGLTDKSLTAKAFMEAVKSLAGGLTAQGLARSPQLRLLRLIPPNFVLFFMP